MSEKKVVSCHSWVSSSFDDFEPTLTVPDKTYKKTTIHPQSRNAMQMKLTKPKPSIESPAALMSQTKKRHWDDTIPAHKLLSVIKSGKQQHKIKSAQSSELWSDKHQPKKKVELAVHKKKVEDISFWLRNRTQNFTKGAAPILLLTGPPGSGKTAAIRAIAADLRLDIREWINPNTAEGSAEFKTADWADRIEQSSVDVYSSQSQSSLFSNFILRANKYQALQLGPTSTGINSALGRFILVENITKTPEFKVSRTKVYRLCACNYKDIPNAFYRDPSELHQILRKYRRCGNCPIVFVITDASSNSSSLQHLFPPALQEELCLESVSVNPVPPTMMVKVLNRIASQEAAESHFALPSARVVESIAMSSAGDIRSAINALQFACRQDTLDLNNLRMMEKRLKKGGSGSGRRLKYNSLARQDSGNTEAVQSEGVIGAKDTTCFLFHALGKILYFKRGDPAAGNQHPTLPAHLSQQNRDPLLLSPEEVVEKTHLNGEYFNTFLHQNYLNFMTSVQDVDRAAEYFSEADLLSAQYTNRGQLQDYSVSVATRGFIHSDSTICCHTDIRKSHGWRPFHKSQWFSVQKQCQQSRITALQLFRGYHWNPEVLLTEIVPFINLTNPTLHSPGQISFVQNLCQYPGFSQSLRSRLEMLEEKSAVDSGDDDLEERPQGKSIIPSSASLSDQPSSSASIDNDINFSEDLPGSQTTVRAVATGWDEEEECIIEEIDD